MDLSKEKPLTGHSVRVDSLDLQNLFNLTSQLLILKNNLLETPEILKISEPKLRQGLIELDRLTKKIEENALSLKLSPIKGLMLKIHRMVVEISKNFNKQVELHFEGEDTKIDREMTDYLSDIFTHLIRNSIDHGIETVEERKSLGKKELAIISIKTIQKGQKVIIELSDDGKGIDRNKVIQKAIEKKLLDPNDDLDLLTDEKVFSFLFHEGFSTAENVTNISGRGVGMGFVKSTIEKLRGKLVIRSTPNQGTTFTITLPIDTSIMDVLVAEINSIPYLISISDIDMIFLKEEVNLFQVPLSKTFLILQNQLVPVIEPGIFFPGEGNKTKGKEVFLTFSYQGRTHAILLDDLILRTQIVFNPLPSDLIDRQNFISGSALLSTGKVSHLLDLPSLVEYHLGPK
jgi:two-component system, chemotaxis family, sensor kinase CheA